MSVFVLADGIITLHGLYTTMLDLASALEGWNDITLISEDRILCGLCRELLGEIHTLLGLNWVTSASIKRRRVAPLELTATGRTFGIPVKR
jgi:hypothetical protein